MSRYKTFCEVVYNDRICGKPNVSHKMCTNHRYICIKHGDPLNRVKAPYTGRSKDPLYKIWNHIYERCYKQEHKQFPGYGGRGISMDDSWNKDIAGWRAFDNFKRDIGDRPKGKLLSGKPRYTLDRINNNQGYKPDNVRWATYTEQNSNTRKNNKVVGVVYDKSRDKWIARLTVEGISYINKRFDTYEEAVIARKKAHKEYKKGI